MPPETMRRRESAKQMMSQRRPQGGELAAAISNSVVKELARATGRGPTEARTTLGENAVFRGAVPESGGIERAGVASALTDKSKRWRYARMARR